MLLRTLSEMGRVDGEGDFETKCACLTLVHRSCNLFICRVPYSICERSIINCILICRGQRVNVLIYGFKVLQSMLLWFESICMRCSIADIWQTFVFIIQLQTERKANVGAINECK